MVLRFVSLLLIVNRPARVLLLCCSLSESWKEGSAPPFKTRPLWQGHSGRKHINPTLQDNVLLPSNFAEHIYHVGSSHDTHSIIQSGLIPGGKDVKKGRHAVFFTAVNPMFIDHHRERDFDVTKPRIAV